MRTGFITVIACALIATGCSTTGMLTSTEPQQTIYTLRPVAGEGQPSNVTARVLEISMPSLPPGMDTDRIALSLAGGQKLDYYAAARWSAPLRDVVQDFTRRSASAVLPYVVAVTPGQGIDPDYKLQIKINEFQPVYESGSNAAPMLKASVEFSLIRARTGKMVNSFTLSQQAKAADNRLDVITSGLEHMLQEIEREAFTRLDASLKAGK